MSVHGCRALAGLVDADEQALVILLGAATAPGVVGKHWLNVRRLLGKFTAAIVVGERSMLAMPSGGGWRRGPA